MRSLLKALGPSSGNPARICCRCITDEVRIRRSVPPDFQRVVLTYSQITSLAVQYRKPRDRPSSTASTGVTRNLLGWSVELVSAGVALNTHVL